MKSSNRSTTYMPGLDGLRAFAVIAVILYHLSVPMLPGGFLGVDLFFVLSGYLITGLLLSEWQQTRRIDLKRFWVHRFRRLFPPLFVLLVLVLSYVTLFERDLLHTLRQDIAASLVYLTNWWYIVHDVSYFESFGKPSPVQNLWSLAIEEQFYLVFPVVLSFGLASKRILLRGIGLTAVLSAVLMVFLFTPNADPSRVYYGTDTRLFTLLIGSLLAFAWRPERFKREIPLRGFRLLNATGAVTIPFLLFFMIVTSESGRFLYYGGFVFVAILAALLIAVVAHPASFWSRLFAAKWLIAIGKRSYGLYLWHFPLITLMTPVEQIGSFSFGRSLGILTVLLIMTELSYHFVERPIRRLGLFGYIRQFQIHPRTFRQFSRTKWVSVSLVSLLLLSFVGNLSILAVSDEPAHQTIPKVAAPHAKPALVKKPTNPVPEKRTRLMCRPTLAIGDSVLLGVEDYLGSTLQQVTIDAKLGRQLREALPLSTKYAAYNQTGHQVVLHLGTNGSFRPDQLDELLDRFANADHVFLVTIRVPRPWEQEVNTMLKQAAERKRVSLIDWHAVAVKHPSYFEQDGVHLNIKGARAYSKLLAKATGCNATTK
ncbi:acyltransferase family protein [Exiguobacterium antarcticum]|uniref:Acyltransferase family protein n=1 Tax=Exiguobacterium antarcticum TaxID=132920 RepID=A0ABT6R5Z8_9BACL|nr:acyltransferase family protein [Exiguobacterium antarcticum]AFS69434.1 Acyltransferase 3 [Exiguobacterium antarcticum B7]MDI3236376.1 acyltransferase family protein [Exiguobacterium antarcticum]